MATFNSLLRQLACAMLAVPPSVHPSLAQEAISQGKQTEAVGDRLDLEAKVEWLRVNVDPIRSVDPSDTDFSDLAPLKSAIGDSRIVMLGEQTHGDGTTFLAKTRLIQFLHQEMGFDVIAFRSLLKKPPSG